MHSSDPEVGTSSCFFYYFKLVTHERIITFKFKVDINFISILNNLELKQCVTEGNKYYFIFN